MGLGNFISVLELAVCLRILTLTRIPKNKNLRCCPLIGECEGNEECSTGKEKSKNEDVQKPPSHCPVASTADCVVVQDTAREIIWGQTARRQEKEESVAFPAIPQSTLVSWNSSTFRQHHWALQEAPKAAKAHKGRLVILKEHCSSLPCSRLGWQQWPGFTAVETATLARARQLHRWSTGRQWVCELCSA